MQRRHRFPFIVLSALALGSGCTDDTSAPTGKVDTTDAADGSDSLDGTDATDGSDATDGADVPETYEFLDGTGASTVDYGGQTTRHLLIADLATAISGLTKDLDGATFAPEKEGDVVELLDFYLRFDSDADGEVAPTLATEPAVKQGTYADVGTKKDLIGKLAGNDASTDHVDWKTAFRGWKDASLAASGGDISYPEGFVTAIVETIEAQALARALDGTIAKGTDGKDLPVHVLPTGVDLQQLLQKFLLGAIAFSQGADDYLDDDLDGKGINAPNTLADGKNWTELEHGWDEGFGYFGAARDYALYTDEEIAVKGGRPDWQGYHDSNGDGAIDLTSEYNFGASSNASKRDLDSVVATDFSGDAISGFLEGRAIITAARGRTFTETERAALVAARDRAIGAWEKAIAASAVHYVNDVLGDMAKFGSADYDFATHAKHWSELKGFALSLQFNPTSPLSDANFEALHDMLGDAPALATDGETAIAAYREALLDARALLGTAYGFATENLGDETGAGGW